MFVLLACIRLECEHVFVSLLQRVLFGMLFGFVSLELPMRSVIDK